MAMTAAKGSVRGRGYTIGLDLAKRVFQAHGASASGAVLFRKKLRCRSSGSSRANRAAVSRWRPAPARISGGEPSLNSVTKNDMADAEAIFEAAQRPTTRFVAAKTEAKQAAAVIYHARDLLTGQRAQLINACEATC